MLEAAQRGRSGRPQNLEVGAAATNGRLARILEGMRVGRLGGIVCNAAKETLRRTRNPSALLAKVPFGQPRILEVEDLGSH